MTHIYRMRSFAPEPDVVAWTCPECGRLVHQHTRTGAITVQIAGAESTIHGGHAGPRHIFDVPEVGAFEVGGVVGRFLEQL